ncbi:P-loop containing nucleoside triphosphate hydrolase protein [Mycena sp. CBHHK59/15]|nr:P-loop containing nucleoside triphosphate hydrolase protein [Mycena sp. CBHHK59/15]
MPAVDEHVKRTAESQRVLQAAREKARRKNNYDSEQTRRDLTRLFDEEFKKPPYEWQIDVSEALVLGLDAVVIAGTGAGKTIPFMMPLLLDRKKFVLVISPLKILQEDQAKRFRKMGLKAAAVNGDTYSRELQKVHTGKRVLAVIVDEAHCAAQWGGDFRPHYALLHRLRALLPVGTPILATSATLSPSAMTEVCSGLDIDLRHSFFLNLGNDRPNITPSVVRMKSGKDYAAVNAHLPNPAEVTSMADVPKTIIFANNVKKTQILCSHLRRRYSQIKDGIAFLHAHRTAKAKRRIMKEFRKGKIKFLVATEAAGMGADIPDIELVIQFGVPPSLSVWTQRAGRAGRSPELHARAILLVEKSMFKRQKKRKRGKVKAKSTREPESSDSDDSSSESGADEPARAPVQSANGITSQDSQMAQPTQTGEPADGLEWGKAVDPILREYISTLECRRDMADDHFNNPPRRPPTGECCDNCTAIELKKERPSQPQTPEPTESPSSSAHSTPSKNRNSNGKRAMTYGEGPKTHRKDHLKSARSALDRWRINTSLDVYGDTSLTPDILLPDKFLTTLGSKRAKTLQELRDLVPDWAFADEHIPDIMRTLSRVDEQERAQLQRDKELRAADRVEKRQAKCAAENPNPQPRKRRGCLPKARVPLATTSANTIVRDR